MSNPFELRFVGVVWFQPGPVAVFKDISGEIRVNEDSLRTRIAKLEACGLPVVVEREGLQALLEAKQRGR